MAPVLPVVVSPDQAATSLDAALVVDLSKPEVFTEGHLPGAVPLAYDALVRGEKPVGGLLPDDETLTAVLAGIGLHPGRQVIAYDDQGNGRAARLVWTLNAAGHEAASILDGGLGQWQAHGGTVSRDSPHPTAGSFRAQARGAAVADREWILSRLKDPSVVLLDTRSEKEYRGEDVRSARGGHIPGAVHFDWVRAMDAENHRRLREPSALRQELEALGVTPDKEVVTYCQTHHRSSHTYVVLRHLGYPQVRGYPGAWSDWGNAHGVPVTVGAQP